MDMNRQEFELLCNANNINTDSIVVGYVTYIITTPKDDIEYQSFVYYNLNTDEYQSFNIDSKDIKKYVKNQPVTDVYISESVFFVDIELNRSILWYKLPDKFYINNIDNFLQYNGVK